MNTRQAGSTLMLVLWALILLSATVVAWVNLIGENLDDVKEANRCLEARAMAHSGMAVAMHPAVGRNSLDLQGQPDRYQSYRVTMQSEGARLNPNYLLAGEDPKKISFFKQYLALKGLTLQERELFTDCLLDWVSPPKAGRRLRGVPESLDYQLPHRPLQSVEEIALVNGSGPLISKPGWKDDLTLYSSGPLDLESAPAELLALVPGVGEQQAARFASTRDGRLVRSPSRDGYPFENLAAALACLGINQQQFAELSGFVDFRDSVVRIVSVGQSRNVTHRTEAVVRKEPGAAGQILLWSEL